MAIVQRGQLERRARATEYFLWGARIGINSIPIDIMSGMIGSLEKVFLAIPRIEGDMPSCCSIIVWRKDVVESAFVPENPRWGADPFTTSAYSFAPEAAINHSCARPNLHCSQVSGHLIQPKLYTCYCRDAHFIVQLYTSSLGFGQFVGLKGLLYLLSSYSLYSSAICTCKEQLETGIGNEIVPGITHPWFFRSQDHQASIIHAC